jgi:hypothetical protein
MEPVNLPSAKVENAKIEKEFPAPWPSVPHWLEAHNLPKPAALGGSWLANAEDLTKPVTERLLHNAEERPAASTPKAEIPQHTSANEAAAKDAGGTSTISPSPEVIEAVVTRIVERMQPKVLDMVTREILRPVVEALVRREIEKK